MYSQNNKEHIEHTKYLEAMLNYYNRNGLKDINKTEKEAFKVIWEGKHKDD